jgi:hypothetical protein
MKSFWNPPDAVSFPEDARNEVIAQAAGDNIRTDGPE